MGLSIVSVFEPDISNIEFLSEGKILFKEFQILDEIAEENGVSLLSSFGDNREIPEDFDGDPDELEDVLGPFDQLFEPENGIITVRVIISKIKSETKWKERLSYPDCLLEELEDLLECLKIAKAENAKFYLELL